MTTISVITPPAPIVTPAEIPGPHAADDASIATMIAAATGEIDGPYGWLKRAIGKQTLELSGCWRDHVVELPLPPLIRVVSVHYTSSDGTETELPSTDYFRRGSAVCFKRGAPWFRHGCNTRIRYEAGFSEADGTGPVPPQVKQAIIMAVQNLKALGAENLFLRSEEVEGVGTFQYTVSDVAGNIIRDTAHRLLRGLKVNRL